MSICFLNGQFLPIENATISVLDRGFIFGDGVYEYVPVFKRKPYRLPGHLARLARTCAEVGLTNPYSDSEWTALIQKLIDQQEFSEQGVYWQVTRGVAKRDHAFPKDVTPTVFMMSNPLPRMSAEQREHGVKAVTQPDLRWHRCDLKTISLMGNILAKQFAAESDAVECILIRDGFLSEASSSNVFVVIDGEIISPPRDHLILPGVTLGGVMELAPKAGLTVTVRPVSEAELRGADEVWLSSSSREVSAVTRLDDRAVGNGKVGPAYTAIRAAFDAEIAALMA